MHSESIISCRNAVTGYELNSILLIISRVSIRNSHKNNLSKHSPGTTSEDTKEVTPHVRPIGFVGIQGQNNWEKYFSGKRVHFLSPQNDNYIVHSVLGWEEGISFSKDQRFGIS